ncbi:hypothetical protein [Mucilaginibacter sp. SP1R1]|uniref:hypothetical protein n=1 Tax=Mucilaginibacter sp. SP1R1 TaxID=2723091 RepID=UPI00161885F6|nr:hypothetical protein [Mucilaginibacter sp. SP1R1]MBB6149454.1 hypothetical protein [Mucilaginibacter sp. SP1R1]
MAIAIKSIPVLSGKAAKKFVSAADSNYKRKSTIDFSVQVEKANKILAKAKLS